MATCRWCSCRLRKLNRSTSTVTRRTDDEENVILAREFCKGSAWSRRQIWSSLVMNGCCDLEALFDSFIWMLDSWIDAFPKGKHRPCWTFLLPVGGCVGGREMTVHGLCLELSFWIQAQQWALYLLCVHLSPCGFHSSLDSAVSLVTE